MCESLSTTPIALFRKVITYFVVLSHLWTQIAWAGGGESSDEKDIPLCLPLTARPRAASVQPAQSSQNDYTTFIKAPGSSLHQTETGLLVRSLGDVVISNLLLNKNLSIITEGKVLFEGDSRLQRDVAIKASQICVLGDVDVKGYMNLWGSGLMVEQALKAGRGAQINLDTLTNKGVLSAFGGGLQGTVKSFVNQGKVDLSHAQVTFEDSLIHKNAVLRTRGHFYLQGDNFKSEGGIFTGGVHQLKIKNTYLDHGYLFVPTLLLLDASTIEYSPFHRSWLSEGMASASTYLAISHHSKINLLSDDSRCFLQLSCQNSLCFDGEITQRYAPFPLGFYQSIWNTPQADWMKLFPPSDSSGFAQELRSLSLEPWTKIRNKWESGVVFHTGGDGIDFKGKVDLDAGSIRKSVKGKLEIEGTSLKAGYFTGDNIQLSSSNAFLRSSEFQALSGTVSALVTEKIQLQNTQMYGREAARLMASMVSMEHDSLLCSLMGPAWVQAKGQTVIRNSGINAHTTSHLQAQTLLVSALQMSAADNRILAKKDATITKSSLQAKGSNTVSSEGTLQIEDSALQADHSRMEGHTVLAQRNTATGTLALKGEKQLIVEGLKAEDVVAIAPNIQFKGKETARTLYAKGKTIKNEGELDTQQILHLAGEEVHQNGVASSEGTTFIEASEAYYDAPNSLTKAGEKAALTAPKTERFLGKYQAPVTEMHLAAKNAADFTHLLGKLDTERAILHFPQANLDFSQDVSITPSVYLWASSLSNRAALTAQADFAACLHTTLNNQGSTRIHGQGHLEAREAISNTGDIQGSQGLGIKTSGFLVHKGLFSGGEGTLELSARKIDATAENLQKRSVLLGNIINAQAETDFLADGMLVRGGDVTLSAGDLLRLGAYVETFRSEEKESSFFGLVNKATRKSWQEANVFEAEALKSLTLRSSRGQIVGMGALLSAPLMRIHGKKGIALNELRLERTEEVEKNRPCFELLGIDLFDPLGEGRPIPKPSIEMGGKAHNTKTTESYGLLGGIAAECLELSTGNNSETNLLGSNLKANHVVTNTSLLKLGGSVFDSSTEESKFKATAGVAYIGGFVPNVSFSIGSSQDRVHGFQSATVQIGHLENQREGMQLFGSQSIKGGIQSSSGKSFEATVDHTQTVTSQSGYSFEESFTGNSYSLSGGARWGSKRSSEGTDFAILNAPNLIQRIDQRYADSDDRFGFNLSLGADSVKNTLRGGLSIQVKDQSFGIDSRMFSAWEDSTERTEASLFERSTIFARDTLGKAHSITGWVSNITSVAALAGANAQEVRSVLSDLNTVLNRASDIVDIVDGIKQISEAWEALTAAQYQPQALSIAEEPLDDIPPLVSEGEEIEMPFAPAIESECEEDEMSSAENNESEASRSPLSKPLTSSKEIEEENLEEGEETQLVNELLQNSDENTIKLANLYRKGKEIATVAEEAWDTLWHPDKVKEKAQESLQNMGTKEEYATAQLLRLEKKAESEGKPWGQAERDRAEKMVIAAYGVVQIVATHQPVFTEELVNKLRNLKEQESEWIEEHLINPVAKPLKESLAQQLKPLVDSLLKTVPLTKPEAEQEREFLSEEFTNGLSDCIFGKATSSIKQGGYSHITQRRNQKAFSTLPRTENTQTYTSSSPRRPNTLVDSSSFRKDSKLKVTGYGQVEFEGVKFRAVRDLSHLDERVLEKMLKDGVMPSDRHGEKLIGHHHQQKYHRNADSFIVEAPRRYHSTGNKRQHPYGNHKGKGLTEEQRKDWDKLRKQFNKERAKEELAKR